MGEITACGICGSTDLSLILGMGEQPLAERMGEDKAYPLALLRCGDCTLVQLSHVVDQREMFPPEHPYASGNTGAVRQHSAALAHELTRLLSPGDLVVDIGANDGTLLREFGGAFNRVAIEPTNQVRKTAGSGIVACQRFFTPAVAREIAAGYGLAKVVTACNVLAHVPDPHDFVQGVATMLAPDGVFVSESHDVRSITTGLQFDSVYHEHIRYYSVTSLSRLLSEHGLEITSVTPVAAYGGSLRVQAMHEGRDLAQRAQVTAGKLRGLLGALDGGIYGIGAATRAVPLIHYAKIAPYIACVCEVTGSEKIGTLMPGTSIAVVDEKALIEDQPAYALIFPWQYAGSIMPKLRAMGYRGRFVIPLPDPKVIDDC